MHNSPSAPSETGNAFAASIVAADDEAPPAANQPSVAPFQPAAGPTRPLRATVLELRVRNHPGTLSHVAGMFARRAFNLEGVLCVPERADAGFSRMLLLVAEEPRLEQVERQLLKLHDVLAVRHRSDLGAGTFDALARNFGPE